MDATPDDLVIIEQKYRDFSIFAHDRSLTHSPLLRSSLGLIRGITCRCSGGLQGCFQCPDQQSFAIFSIYLEIQAKSQVR